MTQSKNIHQHKIKTVFNSKFKTLRLPNVITLVNDNEVLDYEHII